MPRIRTIKPEFFRHESLFEAEQESGMPLRMVFAGLFVCADREGRFRWQPRQLKLDIAPYDNFDFERALCFLAEAGFLIKYAQGAQCYGCIPSWHKHQRINQREAQSEFPAPPEIEPPPPEETRCLLPTGNLAEELLGRVSSAGGKEGGGQLTTQHAVAPTNYAGSNTVGPLDLGKKKSAVDTLTERQKYGGEARDLRSLTERDEIDSSPLERKQADLTQSDLIEDPRVSLSGLKGEVWKTNSESTGQNSADHNLSFEDKSTAELKNVVVNKKKTKGTLIESLSQEEGGQSQESIAKKIFDYWKKVMNYPNAIYDSQRNRQIQNALSIGFSPQQLCQAIKGCSVTPFNMGENDRGEKYNGLDVILKSAEQIERLVRHHHNPPKVSKELDQGGRKRSREENRDAENRATIQRFVEKMKSYAEGHA